MFLAHFFQNELRTVSDEISPLFIRNFEKSISKINRYNMSIDLIIFDLKNISLKGHTQNLSSFPLSHTLSLLLSFLLSLFPSLPLYLTISPSLSLSLLLSLPPSLSLAHTLPFPLSLTHSPSYSPSLSFSLTHSPSLSRFLSPFPSLSLPLPVSPLSVEIATVIPIMSECARLNIK